MSYQELVDLANEAKMHSYCPYSKFSVGVALLTKSGKVYLGANIENSSYGATICAERVACVKAIFDGEKEFSAIALACSDDNVVCYPCGICRQFLSEFGNIDIVLSKGGKFVNVCKLNDIFSHPFELK